MTYACRYCPLVFGGPRSRQEHEIVNHRREDMAILHDRSIIVRNERGEFYVGGGKFTDNLADRKILHYSSIMAAHLDARPAKCTVSFWEEGNEGELREVFE